MPEHSLFLGPCDDDGLDDMRPDDEQPVRPRIEDADFTVDDNDEGGG